MRERNKDGYPKIKNSDVAKKPVDKFKIGLIGGTTVLVTGLAIGALYMTKPDTEVSTNLENESAVGNIMLDSSWDSDWDSGSNGLEESYNENILEALPDDTETEKTNDNSVNQVWYSLGDNNGNTAQSSNPVVSTDATNAIFARVVGQINKQYADKLAKQAISQQPATEPSLSPNYQNMPWDLSAPTDNQSGDVSNQPQVTVESKPVVNGGGNTDGELPTGADLSDELSVWLSDPNNSLTDLDLEGFTVIEGSSVQQKLFDKMNDLTSEIIIDTGNKIKEDEIISWITDNYSNKLLVSKLDYGYLERTERYFYLNITYNTSKNQMKELSNFATKSTKDFNSFTDREKVNKIGKTIADLAIYSKEGKKDVFSPYTLFKEGYGVCQAYTTLGKLMLDQVGIKNGIATGVMNAESHAWNVIEIDGEIIHVDFTNYDTQSNSKYLSISSDSITSDRKVTNIIW